MTKPRPAAVSPGVFAGIVLALLLALDRDNKRDRVIPVSAVLAVLIWLIAGPVWLIELAELINQLANLQLREAATTLVLVLALTIGLFPWPIVRIWLIPRGRVRAAWLLTRLSLWIWRGDVQGGAVIAAAWALNRRREIDPELVAWIERRRDARVVDATSRWRLGGAGIVATALLAAATGDRARARQLFASVAELSSSTWSGRTIVLANEWLSAEAMERGAWREVEFVTRTSPVDSPTLRLFAAIASRLTGIAPLAGDTVLEWRWLRAPHRRRLWPLVRRALATASKPSNEHRATEPSSPAIHDLPDDPLARALVLHATLLRRPVGELSVEAIERTAKAWDAALADSGVHRHVEARELALAARSTDALARLRETVEQELGMVLASARIPLGSLVGSELLERIVRRMHRELLDALEVSASSLDARVKAKRALPAIDEWQAFLALREQHASAVAIGGLELRRLAFSELHGPVCSLAVWLWNERGERALGNAMFQWLLNEAIIVDDTEAIRLQERNVACGI